MKTTSRSWFLPALLVLVLLLALGLRLWGISWGLPLKKAHIDEAVVIFYTMHFMTGDYNPHIFFDYPTLFLYLLGIAFFYCYLMGKAFGVFPSLDEFIGVYLYRDSTFLYLAARSLSVLFAVGTVWLVARIAKENTRSNGLLPALVMALFPLHVLHSHYATVDVACVFFITLSFLYLGRYFRQEDRDRTGTLYRGAFILGLAAAVKYYPAFFLAPLAGWLIYSLGKKGVRRSLAAGLVALAGFIVGCPYAVLDFPAFSSRFIDRFQLLIYGGKAPAAAVQAAALPPETGNRLFGLAGNVVAAASLPLFVALAAGIAFGLYKADGKRRERLLWLLFPASFLLFLLSWKVSTPHYMMAVLPFLAVFGAAGLENLWLTAGEKGRAWSAGTALLIACACACPLAKDVRIDRLLVLRDTRLEARDWIMKNVPPGSTILRFAYTPEFFRDDPYRVTADWVNERTATPPQEFARRYEYIITGSFRNEPLAWEKGFAQYYDEVKLWESRELAMFHHPRIAVYKRKSS